MPYIKLFLSIFILIPLSAIAQNQPTALDVELELFMSGTENTVDIAFYNDTMFLVDQDGIITMVVDGTELADPFLNITGIVQYSGERGLLGLAFDPDFELNRTFYLNYINNSGNTVIAAYTTFTDSLMGDPSTATILKTITQPFTNHNGGQIRFGPDGFLYIGMGDGGSANDPGDRSQDPQELLGKMLRYEVSADSYSIPLNNPFVGDTTTLDDIWALGLRNPWRFSFDKQTGDLWIGDVGQNLYEEVDFQDASSTGGENYGWRCREGMHNFNTDGCGPSTDYDDPIFEYSQGSTHCSVTGGYVYRGVDSDLLNGVYIGIDYCSGYLFGYRVNEDNDNENYDFGNNGFGYTTFGEDEDGELYVARSNGNIYKVIDPCHTQIPSIYIQGSNFVVADTGYTNYEWYYNDVLIEDANAYIQPTIGNGEYYYVIENDNGCYVKSEVINIVIGNVDELNSKNILVYPNPFRDEINISGYSNDILLLSIYSLSGKEIWSKDNPESDSIKLPSSLLSGSYILELRDTKGNKYTQIIFKK